MEAESIVVQQLRRVFKYKGTRYEDPDPGSKPEDVIELLSALEPEMACAYVKDSKLNPNDENEMVYELGVNIGTKA